MARKVKTIDEMPLDLFQALRRGFTRRRGSVRRPPLAEPEQSNRGQPRESAEAATQEIHEKLIDITEKAQDVLFEADTVFPFTLFPDTITLDREKLTVATRHFFRIAKIVSVPVSSVSSAEVDVGPFFGSLHMASKFFVQNKYSVNFLWRKDAVKLQRLLQGFIIAQDKKIDVTDIEKEDLILLLNDLGQGVSD